MSDEKRGDSLLDRVAGYISPTWRRNREVARYQLEAVQAAREYEAAKPSRLRKKRTDNRSPDVVGDGSIETIRGQARSLEQNHDIADGVLTTLVAGVVGEGVRTLPMIRTVAGALATAVNKRLTDLWTDFCRTPEATYQHDWSECQHLKARTWFRDGEVFSQLLMGNVPGHEHGTRVPLSLELLEPDFCPVGLTDMKQGIVQGVKKNPWGRPLSFFFYGQDPRESMFGLTTGVQPGRFPDLSALVEVPSDRVLHLKMVKRIRQTRGVSIFANNFTRLYDLKDFEESERVAARIGAAFAFAITKSPEYQGATAFDTGKLREIGIAPGIVLDNLAPGESVESIKNERPNNQLEAFRRAMLKAVAAGSGASYASIAREYNGTYSAQRQEMLESSVIYAVLRKKFIARAVDPVWMRFVDMAILAGLVDLTGIDVSTIYNVEHRGQGVPYIDPQKEVNADILAIKAGLMSRTATILRRGGDPEETRRQYVEERQKDGMSDLVFSSNLADEKGSQALPAPAPSGGGGTDEEDASNEQQQQPGSATLVA